MCEWGRGIVLHPIAPAPIFQLIFHLLGIHTDRHALDAVPDPEK